MDDGLRRILVGAGLERLIGGYSKQSGFIRRMMAENTLANKGQYKAVPYRSFFHPESTMNKKVPFHLPKLTNESQYPAGTNPSPYGASPFILKHFGTIKGAPFVRKRGSPYPTKPFSKAKKEKPQRQLSAAEADLLIPAGFEIPAGPELQHPELDRPLKPKKARSTAASNKDYYRQQKAAREKTAAERAIREARTRKISLNIL